MKKATLAVALAGTFLLNSFVSQAQAEPQWHFLVKGERDHQEFSSDNADIDTLTLQPMMVDGNWTFTLTLPWQHIDGSVFVNNLYSNSSRLCSFIQDSSLLQSIKSGSTSLLPTSYCNGTTVSGSRNTSTSGWSDAQFFANYIFPVDWQRVNTSLGAGYKHDNGDLNSGLGSGTQDVYAENAWLLSFNPLSFLLTLGYNHILKNSTGFDLKDHGYYSLDSRWQFTDVVAAGVEYDYQQSNTDMLDDYDYYTGYVRLGRPRGLGGRIFVIDYHGQQGFPDREYGASLSYMF